MSDLKKYCTYAGIILTLLLLGFLVPTIIAGNRKKKIQNEGLKDKLLRMCNPSNFMSPYDEQKVSSANDLYERQMSIPAEDTEELKLIRRQAATTLGLNFVDKELLQELINKANPKRYMEPYDAEKVRIANQIYTRLMAGGLDVNEVEQIQEEIKEQLS